MLYTCSISAKKIVGNKRHYTIVLGYGNNEVAPDKHDIDLLKKGVMTARGFALNYEVKLRSPEAYEWMARVSEEASHEDVVLIGKEEGSEKSYRIILAEMMASMFSGKTKFRYAGELR